MQRVFYYIVICLLFSATQAQTATDEISDVYLGSNGDEFTIKAIVTTPEFGDTTNVLFFVQDDSGGLLANYANSECTTTQGDSVRITGTRSEADSQVQLIVNTLESINSNALPDYEPINEADLMVTSNLLGKRVVVSDVGILDNESWPTQFLDTTRLVPVMVGATAFELRIEDASFYNGSLIPCSNFHLSGVLTRFDDQVQVLSFFEGEVAPLIVPEVSTDQELIEFDTTAVGETVIRTLQLEADSLTTSLELTIQSEDFKISLAQGSGYTDSLTIEAENGTIESTVVFIQFAPTSDGLSQGSLRLQSCGIDQEITVKGQTPTLLDPEIIVSIDSINFGVQQFGVESTPEVFSVSAAGLSEALSLQLQGDFEMSLSDDSGYSDELAIDQVDGEVDSVTVYVRFTPSSEGTKVGEILLSSSGRSDSVGLYGISQEPAPEILLGEDTLSFGMVPVNATSSVLSFAVEATGLSDDLSFQTQGDFQLSLSDSADFSSTLTLTEVQGNVDSTLIFVLFAPAQTGKQTGSISVSATGVQEVVILEGEGTAPLNPDISFNQNSLSFDEININTFSDPIALLVNASDLSEIIQLTATGDFDVSLSDSSGYAKNITITPTNGGLEDQSIYVRFAPTTTGQSEGQLSFSSSGITKEVLLSGRAVDPTLPTIRVDKNAISFETFQLGDPLEVITFTVEAVNLEADVSLDVSGDFEIAKGVDGSYSASLLLPVTEGNLETTTIAVRAAATSSGIKNGEVMLRSLDLVEIVDLFAEVTQPDPIIIADTAKLSFEETEIGEFSIAFSFFLEGRYLTEGITVSAPEEFQVSLLRDTQFSSSIALEMADGALDSTEVFVRFTPSSEGMKEGSVSIQSADVVLEISVDGVGIEKEETILAVSNQSVAVYPNPFKGSLALVGVDNMKISVKVTGPDGRIFFNDQDTAEHLSIKLNQTLPDLNSGMYFLTLAAGQDVHHFKIIKE